MNAKHLTAFMAGLMLLAVMPSASNAQGLRPEETLYLKPRVGIAWHLGDTEKSPTNLNMDNWKVDGEFPYAAGLELGYQFNQSTSLGLIYTAQNHPLIFRYGDSVPVGINVDEDETLFHNFQLLFRIAGQGRIAPFIGLGGHFKMASGASADNAFEGEATYGPTLGLGLDIVLSDRMSLVLEHLSDFAFPDAGVDGQDENIFGDDFAPFDLMSTLTLGLKINFKSAFTPVEITSLECPSTLQMNQSGTFAVLTNADATQPVEYSWDFGDGATASGLRSTHSYSQDGTYTVTVTASNMRSNDTETCTVVVDTPVAAEIITLTADRMSFEVCEPVTVAFNANVRGDAPVSYSWDFGDGETSTQQNPTHTFDQAGTYTVRLTVTNDAGSDTRTITITAEPCTSVCATITELNSVFFDRNSSTLSAAARASLQENLEILLECPNLCVRVEGFAAPGERNPQRLSEDRARAVEQFYRDNGIAASRIVAVGMGRVAGVTSKKEGTSQYRRADSIPVPCEELEGGMN